MSNIAIFASGSGTNAENLIRHFKNNPHHNVALVIASKSTAGVIDRCKRLFIPCEVRKKDDWDNQNEILSLLSDYKVDYIVLAGFLLKIPVYLIKAFPDKILNIHPSLLPKFGGKGMYGPHVHQAVIENGEKESGITIHLVNEEYDKGEILFQAKTPVMVNDTPESLATRIHELEYAHFPGVVETYISQKK